MKEKSLEEKVNELSKEVERLSGIITRLSREAALTNTSMLDTVVANATAKVNNEVITNKAVELVETRIKNATKVTECVKKLGVVYLTSIEGKWTLEREVEAYFGKRLVDHIKSNYGITIIPIPKEKGK